jgi:predicted metal-dependent hydrolase
MSSTIFIKTRTRERLKHLGIKGQTYDDLINQLIDIQNAEKHYVQINLPAYGSEPGSNSIKSEAK